jgi:DNA-binding NtrC family response regulator
LRLHPGNAGFDLEQTMLESVVLFVRDVELYESIERNWLSSQEIRCDFAGTAEAAVHLLKGQKVPTLFLDARADYCDEETVQLVSAVMEDFPALNVVTIGNGSYPAPIACELDLLTMHHLAVGADGSPGDAPDSLDRVLSAVRARPIPPNRHVEAEGVNFNTFTSELFPVLDDLMRVAHRDVTLLLVGETGTGKTTLARFIHNRSPRRDKPFQHLACGALPGDLIESELFGHTRGAFTGAERNKIGRFQAAGRGTLLLDEIDVLDLKQQSKLLKVIESGEYEMVGSTEPRQAEARLIVASNVNLEELTDSGRFRSDLYYRLNVLEFRLPPLRNRPLDIVPLAVDFIRECCETHEIVIERIERDFLDALKRYRWPGNLRELKNHMRRAVLFCENGTLTVNDLAPKVLQAQFAEEAGEVAAPPRRGWTLADRVALSERELLEQALKDNDHNRTRTAKALGLSRVGLYKKLRRLGLMESKSPASVESS